MSAVLWLLVGCQPPAPGSAEVEARRESPFEGHFDPSTFREPPGTVVPLTLRVRAVDEAPAGALRVIVPAGLTLREGPDHLALEAWEAGETRVFRWAVRVEVAEERALLVEVNGEAGGARVAAAFSAVSHPAPLPGWSEGDRGARRRVVRLPAQ